MAIEFNRKDYSGYFPAFWRGEAKILPGGFKPVQEFPIGTVIRRGTPVFVDTDKLTAAICKTGKVVAGGTTTAPRVAKGHLFVVGDSVAKTDSTEAVSVKSIDTTNTDYDVITFTKALTGVAADDVIFETGEVSEKAVPKYEPNNVVGSDLQFTGKGLPTLDVAFEALVLIPSLAAPLMPDWIVGGQCMKLNHSIKFIKQ